MIAHASFFFNDVFASMQRGRKNILYLLTFFFICVILHT